jgi:hypothetical protein
MAWKLLSTTPSGVQIRAVELFSRHRPGLDRLGGIGIKKKGLETWEGLDDTRLHELEWTICPPKRAGGTVFLPQMGMPPREPTLEMINRARSGYEFQYNDWFKFAVVLKATGCFPKWWTITIGPPRSGYPLGDDVVISLPKAAVGDLADQFESFEFRTALPMHGTGKRGEIYDTDHLYFIQLLPNELPSYHFFGRDSDNPIRSSEVRDERTDLWFGALAKTSNPRSHPVQKPFGFAGPGLQSPMTRTSIFLKDGRALRTGHKSRRHMTACLRNRRRLDLAGGKPQLEQQASTVSLLDKALSRKRKVSEDVIAYETNKDASEEPQEVALNKPKRKISKPYKPSRDVTEEPQEVKKNKPKSRRTTKSEAHVPSSEVNDKPQEVKPMRNRRKLSYGSKAYKPGRNPDIRSREVARRKGMKEQAKAPKQDKPGQEEVEKPQGTILEAPQSPILVEPARSRETCVLL